MHEFSWTGINSNGKKINGKIYAKNKGAAREKLILSDITPLSLKKNCLAFLFQNKIKLTLKDRIDFTQQLHLLLQASISLTDALSIINSTSADKHIQLISTALNEKILSGISFSVALTHFSDSFNESYCQMIAAGEQSGNLEIILAQLIENFEKQAQINNKIAKALFYPACIMIIALIIAAGLLIFVIPQFSAIYASFGGRLPTATRYLIAMSHYLCHQGIFYILPTLIIIIAMNKTIHKNTRIKTISNRLILKIPLANKLMMTQQTAQWSQLLAMTLSSGIPIIDALHIANHALSQSVIRTQMQEARNAVIAGKALHAALDLCHHFPQRAKTMISIGENADALAHMMKRIAHIYQQELNNSLERLSKLLEPVIMMVVAGFVSGLIIAMYLPIFKMGSVV